MQDDSADACTCKACRPYPHGLRLISSQEIVSTAVAEGLRRSYGLVTETNPELQAALDAADKRLAPFRTDVLRNGL